MTKTRVPAKLRREVRQRAEGRCEYCGIPEDETTFGAEVDHVIAEKHGGATVSENLAFACFPCNRSKGSDLGSLAAGSGSLVRFYNPRSDRWTDHFRLDRDTATIVPLTDIGEATARVLGFNSRERVMERRILMDIGAYDAPFFG